MDPVTLPLQNQPVTPSLLGESSKTSQVLQEHRKIQSAKDFESLLIGKLVDSMKETVGNSGLLEEEGSEQMQAIFWMHLSSALSDQGGVGLWKDIYKNIYGTAPVENPAPQGESAGQLDRTI
jgi:Rod binding domain-containing protein